MTSERWARIKEVFQDALELDAAERDAFLEKTCGGDESLRHEVESLLREHGEIPTLESPVRKRDVVGLTISHYHIIQKLGEGGMGVVYKAEDSRLKRTVALKFVAPHLLADEAIRRRFIREARAAAALDHPNICTVHEIDEADGHTFIAMAYVEGSTTKAKLASGPLRPEEALDIAIQAAEGLRAAHEKGIVHRDVKSANLMVTPHGQVKVMDFGLAQRGDGTQVSLGTAVAGTPAYMSPEQAAGERVDHRTDIWSLGVVIYELVTGRLPAPGGAIIDLPGGLSTVVAKALARDPGDRYQHMEEMLVDLRSLKQQLDSGRTRKALAPILGTLARRRFWYGAGALAAVVLMVLAAIRFRPSGAPQPATPPEVVRLTSYPGDEYWPSISPDGSRVLFSWWGAEDHKPGIYEKVIPAGEPIFKFEGDSAVWSPDGTQIAFKRATPIEGRGGFYRIEIFVAPALGGREKKVGESSFPRLMQRDLTWSADAKSLVLVDKTDPEEPFFLAVLSLDTGEKRRVTMPPERYYGDTFPAFSPDGRGLVFCRRRTLVDSDLYLVRLDGNLAPLGEPQQLTTGGDVEDVAWLPGGNEVVFTAGPKIQWSLFMMSTSGTGKPRRLELPGECKMFPSVSRDGNRLVYSSLETEFNLWRYELPGDGDQPETRAQIARSTANEVFPEYSPDGSRIAFCSDRTGTWDLWICDADGADCSSFETKGQSAHNPSWSPNGEQIVFATQVEGQYDLYVLNVSSGFVKRRTDSPYDERAPSWSQDGQWIYFGSDRSGELQVWKMPAKGGEPIQVTRNGGMVARESRDGSSLYYTKGLTSPVTLWRMPANGGAETLLVEAIDPFLNYAVSKQGVWFRPRGDQVFLLDSATGQRKPVLRLGKTTGLRFGCSISADGRYFLTSEVDVGEADLWLAENFR